ncbi:hypothetical protein Q4S45_13945 [Massilia sp. R2A-15]|uniref:hypothetical protein n=1 Tax=Massilia sp. R2A-15 TaxID=3064278 RepID=UPI0027360098|nr:hypothetical protein [Massilia sp. R2A-15]WLI87839.1 hypothetical protein Q4S45_13945 [Massilia sp. R2A-15]
MADLKSELKKIRAQRIDTRSAPPRAAREQRPTESRRDRGETAVLRTLQPAPATDESAKGVCGPRRDSGIGAAVSMQKVARLASPVPTVFKPLTKSGLLRQKLYRDPADWVACGVNTQMESASVLRHVDIVIGLDFGTSYTKAAVGFMDKIYPVTWEGVSLAVPSFLLASEYTVGPLGDAMFGQHPACRLDEFATDLKLPFLQPGASAPSIARAAVFLGMVLGYIRAWVFRYHSKKLSGATIRWQLNLGAPCNGMESERIVKAYERLADMAWVLSMHPDGRKFITAESHASASLPGPPCADLIARTICPEFVAQMAGYMASPQRVRGLHALIDVGGGTVDIVTFNVHAIEDEDTFPFLVPEVRPLGTHALSHNRLTDIEEPATAADYDELDPVPEAEEFAARAGIGIGHVRERDALFSQSVSKSVRSVFATTKARRYRLSDAWAGGVRTFFTGGGSSVGLYQDAIARAHLPGTGGLLIRPLPLHPRLDGLPLDSGQYQRVSVACGLAQDSFTLARIIAANEVEDDTPVMYQTADRPDRDDIYG